MELRVDGLACQRGGRMLYEGMRFGLNAGGVLVVKGPNGVGKSSMLRQLAGLVPLAAGDARLGGRSLAEDPAGYQEKLVYAGHLDAVKPALTVRDNLGVWARVYGSGLGSVGDVLERFGLGAMAARPAAECSAGQKRRLGLARLMLVARPLWILDEPTVSLDKAGTRLVASMVEAHTSAGGMALIATHIDLGLGPVAELNLDERRSGGQAANDNQAGADPFLEGRW